MATVNEICGRVVACCARVAANANQNKQANSNIFNPTTALYISRPFRNIVNEADLTTNCWTRRKLVRQFGCLANCFVFPRWQSKRDLYLLTLQDTDSERLQTMFRRLTATSSSWVTVPLRLALGVIFIAHGA